MKITIVSETALGPKTDEYTIPRAEMQRIEITLENDVTLRFEEFTDDGFTVYPVSRHRPVLILRAGHGFDLRVPVDMEASHRTPG